MEESSPRSDLLSRTEDIISTASRIFLELLSLQEAHVSNSPNDGHDPIEPPSQLVRHCESSISSDGSDEQSVEVGRGDMGTPLDDFFHLASPALANSKISDQVEWDFVLGGDDADNLLRGPLFQDVDGDFGLQTVLTQEQPEFQYFTQEEDELNRRDSSSPSTASLHEDPDHIWAELLQNYKLKPENWASYKLHQLETPPEPPLWFDAPEIWPHVWRVCIPGTGKTPELMHRFPVLGEMNDTQRARRDEVALEVLFASKFLRATCKLIKPGRTHDLLYDCYRTLAKQSYNITTSRYKDTHRREHNRGRPKRLK